MALPQAVQQQLDDADRLVAQINGSPEDGVTANTVPTVGNIETNPTPTPATPAEELTWQQRYRTLQGMYDAEVPRLHAQLKENGTQVRVLTDEMETMRASQVEKREKASITDEDRESFGPELIDLIERAADSKVETLREREVVLLDQIDKLKSQVGDITERQGASDKDTFLNNLTIASPNWRAVNVDPAFINWLAQVDPIYGLPRQMALGNAYERLDTDRVAAIFNAFSGNQSPAPTPNPAYDLQRLTQPNTSRSSPNPSNDQSLKSFSQQDIENFYGDWRRGLITPDDAARIENDIHAAIAGGRVR